MSLASGVVRVRLLGRQPDQCPPPPPSRVVLVFLFLVWNMYPAGPSQSPGGICILHYLKLGLKLTQKHVDGCTFFSSALQHKVTEKFRKVQNSQFSSFLSEKMCMFIFLAGQYFAKSHRSVPKSALYVTTSE